MKDLEPLKRCVDTPLNTTPRAFVRIHAFIKNVLLCGTVVALSGTIILPFFFDYIIKPENPFHDEALSLQPVKNQRNVSLLNSKEGKSENESVEGDDQMFPGLVIASHPSDKPMPATIFGMQRSDEIDPQRPIPAMKNGRAHISLGVIKLPMVKTGVPLEAVGRPTMITPPFTSPHPDPVPTPEKIILPVPALRQLPAAVTVSTPDMVSEEELPALPVPAPLPDFHPEKMQPIDAPRVFQSTDYLPKVSVAKITVTKLIARVSDGTLQGVEPMTKAPEILAEGILDTPLIPAPILNLPIEGDGGVQAPQIEKARTIPSVILPAPILSLEENEENVYVGAQPFKDVIDLSDASIPQKIKLQVAALPSAFIRPQETPSDNSQENTLNVEGGNKPNASPDGVSLTDTLNRLQDDDIPSEASDEAQNDAAPETSKEEALQKIKTKVEGEESEANGVDHQAESPKVDTLAEALKRLHSAKKQRR